MNKYLIILVVVLITTMGFLFKVKKQLEQQLIVSKTNEMAFANENSELKTSQIAFQYTINELEYSRDSLVKAMIKASESLDIKSKNIKQLQYLNSLANKKDTIVLNDTIFKDKHLALDTLLQNKWYSLELSLKYPNVITVNTTFVSDQHTIIHYEKEFIGERKKFFISRWFQKKHTVVTVDVIENNPYIDIKENRVVEIIQ